MTPVIVGDAVEKASQFGNGCACFPTIEGLVVKDDATKESKGADRYSIMRIQTPQAYRYDFILSLYDSAKKEGIEWPYADGACIGNGFRVYYSRSISANIKITTKSDWFS